MGWLSGFSTFNEFIGALDNNDYYRFSLDSVTEFNQSLSGLSDSAYVYLYVGANNNGQIEPGNYITNCSGSSNSEALLSRKLIWQTEKLILLPVRGFALPAILI